MVKFPHTLFALPFAFSGAALAAARDGIRPSTLVWIALAMVGARNAAMGFNRLVDEDFDRRNPRTANRELPAGRVGRRAVWAFTIALAALFVFASFQLSRTCGLLSFVALAIVFGYSYTKRFTWASHLVLGLGLAIAPVGGWLAVTPDLSAVPWLLAAAVLLWVAGFDVIYACQDLDFDRAAGLHSIPARAGIAGSLWLARLLHVGALLAMLAVGWAAELHPIYWVGVGTIGLLLLREHLLVRPDDLSKLGVAFFQTNAVISLVYLASVLAAVFARALLGAA